MKKISLILGAVIAVAPGVINAAETLKGSGTAADPYQVSTVADWNAFAALTPKDSLNDKYVKLSNDIDFSGAAITPAGIFGGTLDGSGYALKNFTLTPTENSQSIFTTITADGKVANLTLKGTVTAVDPTYVAGLVGTLYGTLDNVTNESDVTGKNAAGLVGTVETGALLNKCVNKGKITAALTAVPVGGISALAKYGATYTNCVNEGTISRSGTAASAFGGITGTAGNATFINCSNIGKIATDINVIYVGGIVGNANGLTDPETGAPLTIKNCFNTSDIEARGLLGGIVGGRQSGAGKNGIDIQDCYNTGNFTLPNTSVYSYAVGGIIGQAVQGNIINCYNTGNINAVKTAPLGGIFGKMLKSGAEERATIVKNCYNTGNITGGLSTYMVGGIGGQITSDSHLEITNCYNTGNVHCPYTVGGIVGAADKADNTISQCYNTGNISSVNKWAGGIIGKTVKSTTTVEYCWNSGNVSTQGTLGGDVTSATTLTGNGIGGIIGVSGASVNNCYNMGTITGASQVGGIVGLTELNTATVTKCYNAGAIIAPADTCGAILGIKTADNLTRWGQYNKVEDCYYVSNFLPNGTNNLIATPKTMADLASGAFNMGTGWTNVGENCTPTFTYCKDVPAALVSVAQVVLNGEDYDKVTTNFKVGTPSGVEWTSSNSGITFSGNQAKVKATSKKVDTTLTAKNGDFSRNVDLIVGGVSGLDEMECAADVVAREFYTLDGVATVAPESKDGKVYIVVLTLTNGTKRVVKMLN